MADSEVDNGKEDNGNSNNDGDGGNSNSKSKEKEKIAEFRNRNIELMNKVKELNSKIDSIDMNGYNSYVKDKERIEEEKLKQAGKFEELLSNKLKEQSKEYEEKHILPMKKELEYNKSLVRKLILSDEVNKLSLSNNANPKAIDAIRLMAERQFSIVDGVAAIIDPETNMKKQDKNGNIYSLNEWFRDLKSNHDYLFNQSTSAGSTGSSKNHQGWREQLASMSPKERIKVGLDELEANSHK